MRCDRRRELAAHLRREGIATGIHYEYSVHVQPGLAVGTRIAGSLQTTETVAREILSLPIYPSLSYESQERVINAIPRIFPSVTQHRLRALLRRTTNARDRYLPESPCD